MFALSKGSLTWPITDRNNEFASGGEDNPTTKFHGSALATREISVIKPNSYGPEGWLVNVKWTWFWGALAYAYVGDPSDSHSRSQMFTQKTLTTTTSPMVYPWFIHHFPIIYQLFWAPKSCHKLGWFWWWSRSRSILLFSTWRVLTQAHFFPFLVESWCLKPKSWKDSGNMSSIKFIKILLESH